MKNKYSFVSEFKNGYAFARRNAEFNNRGLINIDGVEVIPTKYYELVGSVYDDFFIGIRKIIQERKPVVDWDYECDSSPISIMKGNAFYLLDKEGHEFALDIDSRCEVVYDGKRDDGSSHFYFTYKNNRNSNYYDVYEHYTFYPGKDYVLINNSCDESYIQYFDGTIKKINFAEYNEEVNKTIEQKVLIKQKN